MSVRAAFEIFVNATNAFVNSDQIEIDGYIGHAVEIDNETLVSMSDFKVQAKDHDNGEWYDFLTGTDFGAGVGGNLLFMSADPRTITAGTKAHLQFRCLAKYLRFVPKLASSTGIVFIRGQYISVG